MQMIIFNDMIHLFTFRISSGESSNSPDIWFNPRNCFITGWVLFGEAMLFFRVLIALTVYQQISALSSFPLYNCVSCLQCSYTCGFSNTLHAQYRYNIFFLFLCFLHRSQLWCWGSVKVESKIDGLVGGKVETTLRTIYATATTHSNGA